MSPTRRDLVRRAALSVTALPIAPVAGRPPGLASVIDTTKLDRDLFGLTVQLWEHWHEWPPSTRAQFLTVLDREFPDLSAAIDLIASSRERERRARADGGSGTVALRRARIAHTARNPRRRPGTSPGRFAAQKVKLGRDIEPSIAREARRRQEELGRTQGKEPLVTSVTKDRTTDEVASKVGLGKTQGEEPLGAFAPKGKRSRNWPRRN